MPQSAPAQSVQVEGEPLTEGELSELDRRTRRVHAELRALVNAFPPHVRNASELSRQLEVERTTCQRIVSEVVAPYKGPESAVRLPGAKGMAQFTEAVGEHGISRELVDSANAAIHQLTQTIRAIAGSQSRLNRRLRASREGEGVGVGVGVSVERAAGDAHVREHLHQSGMALTGHATDVSIATLVFRPNRADPGLLDRAQLRAFIGHRMRRGAMPFSLFWFDQSEEQDAREGQRFSTLDHEQLEGRSQGVVLPEFSTDPLPLVTSRGPSSRTVLQIDPREVTEGEPFDLVVAGRSYGSHIHPARDDPPHHEVWKLGRYPERLLIFDVLLHRSLARACIPSAGAYLVSPFLGETVNYRWLDRYPTNPPLQVIPPGIENMAHPACPRYPEMVAHLFDRVEWDPAEYVGYRCALEHPIFSAGYCMTFDYASQDESGQGS